MMMSRVYVKAVLAKTVTTADTTIVIASSGRQGSTMLFHAVRDCIVRDQTRNIFRFLPTRLLGRLITGYPWTPEEFGVLLPPICKTHIPINQIPDNRGSKNNTKVLFLFGDPKDSAYSAFNENLSEGSSWIQRHQEHLMGQGDESKLFSDDILNFKGQMRAAMERKEKAGDSTMLVHYQDLWDELAKIREFLGLDISLPTFRARQKRSDYISISWGDEFEEMRQLAESVRIGNQSGNV